MNHVRRFLDTPAQLRTAAWLVWLVSVPIIVMAAAGQPYSTGVWTAVWSPLLALVGWWLPRYRAALLAAAAGLVATWTAETQALWPLVATYTLVSMVEDRRAVPVAAWVGGIVGSVLSLVLFVDTATVAPFFAVAIGGGLGLLVRSRMQVAALVEQTGDLEEQTRWLEQRTALARELHDVVGHHVTAMVVQAEAGLVGEPERALGAIGDLGRTALAELDALVVHLRDPDAPLAVSAPPRLSDIDELLAAPLRLQGVEVAVRVGDQLVLDEVQVLTVYRIVQEALTNVARHAQATAASVEVVPLDRHLRVRVTDDGVGAPASPARGSGLLGIQERVAAQGGSWELASRLGGGTVVDVVLPLEARA